MLDTCEICIYAHVRCTDEEWYHYCDYHHKRLKSDLDDPCDDFKSIFNEHKVIE